MSFRAVSESLAGSFWFTIIAYICALLPWTVISNSDFIGPEWRSVRSTRREGYRTLLWIYLPMGYVFLYSAVQASAEEYSEMCASAIAAMLAAFWGLQTLWGLWQLHEFRIWVEQSINALNVMGIEYRLYDPGNKGKKDLSSKEISERIRINEKVVDNQFFHGDVRCYLRFGNKTILRGNKEDTNRSLVPLGSFLNWIKFFKAITLHFFQKAFLQYDVKTVEIVPMKAEDLLVRWISVFVSQGLKMWVNEFKITESSLRTCEKQNIFGRDQYRHQGQQFASECIASTALHLWHEYGDGKGLSPMLWNIWDNNSAMSDGRVVLEELVEDACTNGSCLPFKYSLVKEMSRKGGKVGFHSYEAFMEEFIAELPVRFSYVEEMRKFKTRHLEWLLVFLHLGKMSMQHGFDKIPIRKKEAECHVTPKTLEQQVLFKEMFEKGKAKNEANTMPVGNLVLSNLPVISEMIQLCSSPNRLVQKSGEFLDIWLSLVAGDQIRFLVQKLNPKWHMYCNASSISSAEVNTTKHFETEKEIYKANKELEKRRLERRLADKLYKYRLMDSCIRFMGYRMESVRTILARYSTSKAKIDLDDIFANLNCTNEAIAVDVSESMYAAIRVTKGSIDMERRTMKCRLIWDVQNALDELLLENKVENESGIGMKKWTALIILFIISMPGLEVEVRELDETPEMTKMEDDVIFNLESTEVILSDRRYEIVVRAICAPQDIYVTMNFRNENTCLMFLNVQGGETFNWRYWKEAFLGRLDGAQEWRHEMTICTNERKIYGLNHNNLQCTEDSAAILIFTGGKCAKTWKGWLPFDIDFCKFELEAEGFLCERKDVRHRRAIVFNTKYNNRNDFGNLRLQKIAGVSYNEANERILMAAKNSLVRSSLMKNVASGSQPFHAVGKSGSELADCSSSNGISWIIGTSAGKNCKETLSAIQDSLTRLMKSNSSKLALVDKGESSIESDILPECERLIQVLNPDVHILKELITVLNTCLTVNSDHFKQKVLQLTQQIVLFTRAQEPSGSMALLLYSRVLSTTLEVWRHFASQISTPEQVELNYSRSFEDEKSILCILEFISSCPDCEPIQLTPLLRTNTSASSAAYFDLAHAYSDGMFGVTKDIHRAISLYETAISQSNHIESMFNLAVIFEQGTSNLRPSPSRSVSLYNRAIEEGQDVDAMFNLAGLLRSGAEGVPADPARAARLYEQAIKVGNNIDAMFNLAVLLEHGALGVPQQPRRAVALYEQAIDAGNDADAIFCLAQLLESGSEGFPADPFRAVNLYSRAICEHRHIESMVNLGVLLQHGWKGVPEDGSRAMALYMDAIEIDGHTGAMFNLGLLLQTGGKGVVMDVKGAKKWYERAIMEGGVVEAMTNLGEMMENGAEGVIRDEKEAVRLYERAIKEGDCVDAMCNLAEMRRKGKGGSRDEKEAIRLYQMAAGKGDKEAQAKLVEMGKTGKERERREALERL